MNREPVQQIIMDDLGMRKISANVVPQILTDDEKQCRLHISADLLYNAEMFITLITGVETWCFEHDPERRSQSMQWKTQNSPLPRKARMFRLQFKTMLVCFFDHKGIVHNKFIAQGQMLNSVIWKC
jgi:hypothetical protein